MKTCDVAIIGAGPYGLAAAAHLRSVKGLEVSVFGEAMSFWERNMPIGMFLRSNWTATQIASPDQTLTLEAYQAATGDRLSTPMPRDGFVRYGRWFQRQAVSDLDERRVLRIEPGFTRFRLILENGEDVTSSRVIIAVGIGAFAYRPSEFGTILSSLASHTSTHRDFSRFVGQKVLIVGGGQSALESGALLHELKAEVEIVSRSVKIHWLQGRLSKTLHHGLGTFVRHLLYAPTDVGPAGLSQLMARPDLLRRLPRNLQDRLRKRSVRPAGARWLLNRLVDVPIRLGRAVVSVVPVGDRVRVKLDDGSERTVDHILLGTGYRIDLSKYEFLSPALLGSIERFNGYPVLRNGLETSVPGLHILGAPAAWSFGPLMQFVSGTTFASRALTRVISEQRDQRVW
jgi:cation diffusion facilitator CzcD-associated flavoprotein CzcO